MGLNVNFYRERQMIAASTSSAGTMMERIEGRAQGQMSQGGGGKAEPRDLHEGKLNGEHPVCPVSSPVFVVVKTR